MRNHVAFNWHQTWQLYRLIPMKATSILPDEGFAARPVELNNAGMVFDVYCVPKRQHANPSRQNKSSKHRVFAVCTCGRHVPFGRMGQHYTRKCARVEEGAE